MRVRMLNVYAGVSGTAQPGQIVDVPQEEARQLVDGRYAERVDLFDDDPADDQDQTGDEADTSNEGDGDETADHDQADDEPEQDAEPAGERQASRSPRNRQTRRSPRDR